MKQYQITENNITYDISKYPNGNKYWRLNNKYHRENGPAIEYANGNKSWFKNGLFHRLDGPAIEYASGLQEWYKDGRRHREDGPAVTSAIGYRKEYWYNGKRLYDINSDKDLTRYVKLLSIS